MAQNQHVQPCKASQGMHRKTCLPREQCQHFVYIFCRANTRTKLHRLLMIYDDELRNPSGASSQRFRSIEEYDYDAKLARADCNADLAHLAPQVH